MRREEGACDDDKRGRGRDFQSRNRSESHRSLTFLWGGEGPDLDESWWWDDETKQEPDPTESRKSSRFKFNASIDLICVCSPGVFVWITRPAVERTCIMHEFNYWIFYYWVLMLDSTWFKHSALLRFVWYFLLCGSLRSAECTSGKK